MGLIRTGITAGAALGGIKMVTNHLEKTRSSNASASPSPAPGQSMAQVPVHPQCSCPYCPQNAHAQPGFGGSSNNGGGYMVGNPSHPSQGWVDQRGGLSHVVYGNNPPAYVGAPQGGQWYEQEKKSVEHGQR
ncbi:hypothetical protein JCM24511_03653 [Saitozyma sp. JCM 24511]|nr:hypothetical protein JCM24511_03653 [Saitozyma sp. JCM 24511]